MHVPDTSNSRQSGEVPDQVVGGEVESHDVRTCCARNGPRLVENVSSVGKYVRRTVKEQLLMLRLDELGEIYENVLLHDQQNAADTRKTERDASADGGRPRQRRRT